MHRKRLRAIMVVVLVVAGIALGYVLYISRSLPESKAIEISKQSSVVQRYFSLHLNTECTVMKLYIESDGSVYTVDDHWELVRYVGGSGKPIDGKDHYCWKVHWYDPAGGIPHIVNVFVDKDSWDIVLVGEAD